MKKNSYKNFLLDTDFDDESESVCWVECDNNKKKYYNCGCCDECLCDDNIQCYNCGCNCSCDDIDDDYDIDETDEESEDDTQLNKKLPSIYNFDINIVESKEKEKKVRITLELNVSLSDNKKEIINIDLDINKTTYLKIAEELFKK